MNTKAGYETPFRLVKWCTQWRPLREWQKVPRNLRGIYVLHKFEPKPKTFNVVYIGIATSGKGIWRRLKSHKKYKQSQWTHFSFFAVWENIRKEEIIELESLFREIYRKDERANSLNKQKGSKKLRSIRRQRTKLWSA
jgi:hypothetical protein